jgi:hypothetical protein
LRGGVYFEAYFFAFFVLLFLGFILDLIFFAVTSSFQDVSGWKMGKIVRDLQQAQKGNYYGEKMLTQPLKQKTKFLSPGILHTNDDGAEWSLPRFSP